MKKTYAVASFRARSDILKVWSIDANSPAGLRDTKPKRGDGEVQVWGNAGGVGQLGQKGQLSRRWGNSGEQRASDRDVGKLRRRDDARGH